MTTTTTTRATGTFEVKMSPLPPHAAGDPTFGRRSLAKELHGDLEGTSEGEMMMSMSQSVQGSGVYVAIERVTGTLQGRSGSFALHHVGVMTRGAPELRVSVVPDSGTGQLTGIAGQLAIRIVDGKHFYDLDYTLPDAP